MTDEQDSFVDRFFARLDAKIAAVRPAVSELLRAEGYEPYHTGGGCMAWQLTMNPDQYLWITNHDDLDGDPEAREWLIGRYHEDGGWVNVDACFTLREAIEYAPRLRPAKLDDGSSIERVYPTLESALLPPGEVWHGAMNTAGDEISIVKTGAAHTVEYVIRGHDREGSHTYEIARRLSWGAARAFLCRYTGNFARPDLAEPGVDDQPGGPPARVIHLTCACCGGPAPALKQWWNRDTGYGLCGTCATRIQGRTDYDAVDFERTYGIRYIHWFPNNPQAE